MYYQIHEKHGRHTASTLNEKEANEKNGWKTVTELEFYGFNIEVPVTEQKIQDAVPVSDEESEETQSELSEETRERLYLEIAYENKFGKPPHHRMKNETIREALEG